MSEKTTRDPAAEIGAMQTISKALEALDSDAVTRVLAWASSAFGAEETEGNPVGYGRGSSTRGAASALSGQPEFESAADLFAAASPQSEADGALVVGYWLQVIQGQSALDAGEINRELKHLGHGASNITRAMSSLIERKPQLVIQTRKTGSSKQARKRYRLTTAGIEAVKQMIGVTE